MGINGRTPDVPLDLCDSQLKTLWKKDNFTYHKTGYNAYEKTTEYTVDGWMGTKAGDGGDGGKQGDRGLAGQIMAFELGQISNLKTYTINGMNALIDFVQFMETFLTHFRSIIQKVRQVQSVEVDVVAEVKL